MPLSSGFILTSVLVRLVTGQTMSFDCHTAASKTNIQVWTTASKSQYREGNTCNSLIAESPSNITQDASLPGSKGHVFFSFRMERDADFLHKKAERATLRVCLREKYRLPKVKRLWTQLQMSLTAFIST